VSILRISVAKVRIFQHPCKLFRRAI
jgi:hypothetical protein